MQELVQPPPSAVARNAKQVLRSLIPFTLLFLTACAVQNTYRFTSKSITRVTYDPKQCVELPDGRYKCKDVLFTVSAIEPVNPK
ncbi:MAG TPA: hypothetical protein VKE93_13855 [Candidatus Angelobacter sp.]|nr:hypothetical protein [Candidatus Angelobacter sp.]